jgi:hypothetical protein
MVNTSSGHHAAHGLRDRPRSLALPFEAERLVMEARIQADGDPSLAIALLRDRLVCDPASTAERAIFFDWLAGNSAKNRVRQSSRPSAG